MVAVTIRVRVMPRAGRDEVIGWLGDELRVRVKAPPVEGQANEAVCRLVAKAAGVPYSNVAVVSGAKARVKTLQVEGLSEAEARTKLS